MIGKEQVLTIFIALFAIIDPFGNIPVFLALTERMDISRKKQVAIKSCFYAFLVLLLFLFLGRWILNYFGISVPAFQVGGGVIIFLAGLPMLFARPLGMRSLDSEIAECSEREEVSLVPLAVPMLAGPGAITTVVVLTDRYPGLEGKMVILGAVFSVLAFTALLFWYAERILRGIGQTGLNFLTRIMGLILVILAVQYILSGIKAFFQT